jgi:hypothetical protein
VKDCTCANAKASSNGASLAIGKLCAMKASIAGVSVRMPRSVTSDGTRPFGLIPRYSWLFCWLVLKSTFSVV